MGDFDKKGTSKPSVFNGLEIPRVYILFREEEIMKKQWLSIVLVLCMVLCMVPTTALAAESKTCELKITVGVNGLTGSAEGATFTFQIKKAINEVTAQYYEYGTMTVTVGADGTTGTNTIAVEEGKYIVQQVGPGDPIGEYVWYSISYTGGNNESGPQSVYGNGNSTEFKVYNTYRPASETKVTTLPITVTGYKAGANVADAKVTTTEPGIKLSYFQFMEKDSAGDWTSAPLTGTFKADTEYRVEVYFNKLLGCDYTGLKKENVTVNGVEADAFETTWSGFPYNKDYQVIRGLGKPEVVKTVESIEITKQPDKIEYMAGEDFDPTGMVVTAHYTDGTTADLPETGYTIFRGTGLMQGQTDVTIQYNDGSGSSNIKTYQNITVKPYVGPHTHTYGGPWYADAKSHWHQCTDSACPDPSGSTKDLASHTFVWKVDKAATETQTGLKHEECTVCSYKRSENTEIPALRDYAVTVTGGTATVAAGTTITRAMEGVEVTVTADAPETGKVFDKWVVKAGGVTLANETSATTTFTMPGNDMKIEATYKDAPPSHSVYVGMTYTAGNFIYQITSIDTATLGQSKVIGVVAAKKNKITKVTIPDRADCKGYGLNVTTIGNNAFAGCKALEKLTIGNKVTVIGKNAFKKCSKLKTVVIGKAVKTISSKAFIGDNKIKKITFKGKKLKTVKKNAFSKKAKKNIKSKKTKLKGNKKAIKLFKKKLKIK